MTGQNTPNNSIRKRIRQLIIAEKLGVLSDFESSELEQLLDIYPEMKQIHEMLMNDTTLSSRYRQSRPQKGSKGLHQKWGEAIVWAQRVPLGLRVAAVVLPLLLGGIWFTISNSHRLSTSTSESALLAQAKPDEWLERIDLNNVLPEENKIADHGNEHTEPTANSHRIGDLSTGSTFKSNDKEFLVVLEDGTEMHLGYNTKLTYPRMFRGKTREVRLEGEAYVKVAKDKRPFIIHTPNGNVRQFGTSFHISSLVGENKTEVVLVEGSVGLYQDSSNHPMTMLKPGEKAVLEQEGDISIEKTDILPYTSWDNGYIAFEKMPFERLMNILSHWYRVQVEFEDQTHRNKTVTGSFSRQYDLSDILQSLSITSDIPIRLADNTIIVGQAVP